MVFENQSFLIASNTSIKCFLIEVSHMVKMNQGISSFCFHQSHPFGRSLLHCSCLVWSGHSCPGISPCCHSFFQCFFLCAVPHSLWDFIVSQLGIRPGPLAVRAWNPNHLINMEFLLGDASFSSLLPRKWWMNNKRFYEPVCLYSALTLF